MDNEKTREEKWERIGLVILAGVSVVAGVYSYRQLRKAVRLVSKAADSVSELTVVDIQNDIVDRAINNAANREVSRAVSRAVRSVENDISNQTQSRVQHAVKECYGRIGKVVSDNIAKEAAKIDTSSIMDDATEKAKEILLERFDGKLDGLMSDYQRNLDNVGKIYQSIAASMADRSGKDVTLKLG
jgi:hypothetical protein